MNHLQVGRFAEYYAKMEFALYGFQVYTSEVDDRGIDFIVRHETGPFYEVQVKSSRGGKYIFFPKEHFPLSEQRLAVVIFLNEDEPPDIYLIPATTWKTLPEPFVSRDYEGKQSKPEWGINVSQKNMKFLKKYSFDATIGRQFPALGQ
ncbi:DUF4365 domain-containing protein [Maioricimonas sp. JC845]|uniref:DUF4365 domain-containing protein n=1 Tax=Maioricimonas sp. JC845 TaxID=3232138 RepID=UPI003458F7B4